MEPQENYSPRTVFEEKSTAFERLIMLCDGIFAIAMTLLVLDIKLPAELPTITHEAFLNDLGGLLTKSLFYLLTFATLAVHWLGNRRLMTYIKRQDIPFTLLTFLFLAFVVFFPVSLNVLVSSRPFPEVIVFYTLVLAGCGFSAFILWFYASWHHRLIDPEVSQQEIVSRSISTITNPVYFCLSLLLLLIPHINVFSIFYSWVLIPVFRRIVHFATSRLEKRISPRKESAEEQQLSEAPAVSEREEPEASKSEMSAASESEKPVVSE